MPSIPGLLATKYPRLVQVWWVDIDATTTTGRSVGDSRGMTSIIVNGLYCKHFVAEATMVLGRIVANTAEPQAFSVSSRGPHRPHRSPYQHIALSHRQICAATMVVKLTENP
jgi:hypothetical protein